MAHILEKSYSIDGNGIFLDQIKYFQQQGGHYFSVFILPDFSLTYNAPPPPTPICCQYRNN